MQNIMPTNNTNTPTLQIQMARPKSGVYHINANELTASLGRDSPGETATSLGYGEIEDKSPWVRCTLPVAGEMRMNPVVCILSLAVIIVFVILAMVQPLEVNKEFGLWRVN